MLAIDLTGKTAFVAGIADDQGFGWAIAKALASAGANVIAGTWAPVAELFQRQLAAGKFDDALPHGGTLRFEAIYPMDAQYDHPADVPPEVAQSKRYINVKRFTLSELAENIERDFGQIDCLVHSLAQGREVQQPLLRTSRAGYLAALSASTYSLVGLMQVLAPLMPQGASAITLSYVAAQRVIPGYGGGMSGAKAALESDVRQLAWELGKERGVRLNAISAGPVKSRAANAIGFIDDMIAYSNANAPLAKSLTPMEVGHLAAFLLSPLASAITGSVVFADNGLHAMGVARDSQSWHHPQKSTG